MNKVAEILNATGKLSDQPHTKSRNPIPTPIIHKSNMPPPITGIFLTNFSIINVLIYFVALIVFLLLQCKTV